MSLEISVGKKLRKKKLTLSVAESCTGGLISNRLTNVSGSSDYFKGGIIAYSNHIKQKILGVSPTLIKKHGVVSKEVALEMAKGVRRLVRTDIGIGVTGIAGPAPYRYRASPTGGTKSKPIGLVYIALVTTGKQIVKEFRFKGSRKNIKLQASQAALNLLTWLF